MTSRVNKQSDGGLMVRKYRSTRLCGVDARDCLEKKNGVTYDILSMRRSYKRLQNCRLIYVCKPGILLTKHVRATVGTKSLIRNYGCSVQICTVLSKLLTNPW